MSTHVEYQVDDDRYLTCMYEETELFVYDFAPTTRDTESPRPFMRHMRTLQGNDVTCFRPSDHRWHVGLSMTFAELSGQNFWGGSTFVDPDHGYRQLDNNGTQEHVRFEPEPHTQPRLELLNWRSSDGDIWLDERRSIGVGNVDTEGGYWTLDWQSVFTNRTGAPLEFGSPTTRGRPNAGYGGLFWRGPRSFTDGSILTADGVSDAYSAMGTAAAWVAFRGPFDETDDSATMVFIDSPENIRYPNKWFIRNASGYAAASFAFMFDEVFTLPAQQSLSLRYTIVVGDGEWDAGKIAEVVHDHCG